MRIRILQKPGTASIDGVRLDRFRPGQQYEVGHLIGSVFLAEGWVEPVDDMVPAPVTAPHNVIRELFPPYYDAPLAQAADYRRGRHRRSK
jgi:hypothetical protein